MTNGITFNQFKTAVLNEVVKIKTINGEVSVELTDLDCNLDFNNSQRVINYSANTEGMMLDGTVTYPFGDIMTDDHIFDSERTKDLMRLILSDIKSTLNNEEKIVNVKALFKQTAYEV